jgi:hypothetical protein
LWDPTVLVSVHFWICPRALAPRTRF